MTAAAISGYLRFANCRGLRHKGLVPPVQKYLKRIFYGNVTPGDDTESGFLFEVVFDYKADPVLSGA